MSRACLGHPLGPRQVDHVHVCHFRLPHPAADDFPPLDDQGQEGVGAGGVGVGQVGRRDTLRHPALDQLRQPSA